MAGGVGGEDEIFDVPRDEGEAAVGRTVAQGIPIVVRPIDVGSPEIKNEVFGEGIDVELLTNRIVDRLTGNVSIEGGEKSIPGSEISIYHFGR